MGPEELRCNQAVGMSLLSWANTVWAEAATPGENLEDTYPILSPPESRLRDLDLRVLDDHGI